MLAGFHHGPAAFAVPLTTTHVSPTVTMGALSHVVRLGPDRLEAVFLGRTGTPPNTTIFIQSPIWRLIWLGSVAVPVTEEEAGRKGPDTRRNLESP